jgi:hypothetical protein
MTVGEERLKELEVRPPPGLVGSNAAPPTPPTAMGVTRKRSRMDSVPPAQAQARPSPALLSRNVNADPTRVADEEEPRISEPS